MSSTGFGGGSKSRANSKKSTTESPADSKPAGAAAAPTADEAKQTTTATTPSTADQQPGAAESKSDGAAKPAASSSQAKSDGVAEPGASSTQAKPDAAAKPAAESPAGKPGGGAKQTAHTATTKVSRESEHRPAVSKSAVKGDADAIRNRIAALVWLVAVLAAVVLASGALLVALDANPDNTIVDFVRGLARDIDGPFWNLFTFTGENAKTKELLVNWGIAAVAYLVAGKILDRIIRP